MEVNVAPKNKDDEVNVAENIVPDEGTPEYEVRSLHENTLKINPNRLGMDGAPSIGGFFVQLWWLSQNIVQTNMKRSNKNLFSLAIIQKT